MRLARRGGKSREATIVYFAGTHSPPRLFLTSGPQCRNRPSLNTLKNTKVVRVSGQLFFDASHHACKDDRPGSGDPIRISSWEIHPIYDIKVCKKSTVSDCRADDASVWRRSRKLQNLRGFH